MMFSGRTALLLLAAVLLACALQWAQLPAAWLFGPLVVSAVFAVRGWEAFQLPRPVYIAAQAVIGTALGAGFSPSTLLVIPQHLAIFAFAVVFILLTSLFNGWVLARGTSLDVATAFLGTMPGGAGEMAAMSDSLHADTRLVVVMQYTRLLIILGTLAFLVPVLSHFSPPAATSSLLVPVAAPFAWWKIGVLFLLVCAGWIAGMGTRIPAGTFLVPAVLYLGLALVHLAPGRWPMPIFAAAYLVMGVQIGGRFHPSTIAAIRGILLPVCGTTLILLSGSFALAWFLAREMKLDPVSAYLAATPGGLDSVAAIATELHGDTAIILTVHLVRLLCVLILGPWLVRLCAKGMEKKALFPRPVVPEE
jgi:membrane AbrB-like protein